MSTFNPSDKSATITLSNGDLTATKSGSGDGGVRGTLAHNSGKYYLEFLATQLLGGNSGAGIASSTANLSSVGGAGVQGFIIFGTNVWYNGSNILSIGGSGTLVASIAIDFTVSPVRAWARNGSNDWNGSALANPSTNTGGTDVSTVFGSAAAYPLMCSNLSGDVATLRTTTASFTMGAPSGFDQWDGTPASFRSRSRQFSGF